MTFTGFFSRGLNLVFSDKRSASSPTTYVREQQSKLHSYHRKRIDNCVYFRQFSWTESVWMAFKVSSVVRDC